MYSDWQILQWLSTPSTQPLSFISDHPLGWRTQYWIWTMTKRCKSYCKTRKGFRLSSWYRLRKWSLFRIRPTISDCPLLQLSSVFRDFPWRRQLPDKTEATFSILCGPLTRPIRDKANKAVTKAEKANDYPAMLSPVFSNAASVDISKNA